MEEWGNGERGSGGRETERDVSIKIVEKGP